MSWDDNYDDIPDDCLHEEADIDILTGRALCHVCGHAWWASDAEIEAQATHEREYAEAVEREELARRTIRENTNSNVSRTPNADEPETTEPQR